MIREALQKDIKHVTALMRSIPDFWNDEWRPDVVRRGIFSANGLAFVWEENQRIGGFVCAHDLGFRAYLSELVVAADLHGRHIGQQLLEKVEQALIERGCTLMIADVWKDAEGFYRKCGWSPPDVILLRKKLI
jgi:GNAT superfamily N-acetyltransferase